MEFKNNNQSPLGSLANLGVADIKPDQYKEIEISTDEAEFQIKMMYRRLGRSILTNEEHSEALRLARKKKAGELYAKEYAKKINTSPIKITLSTSKLFDLIIQKANKILAAKGGLSKVFEVDEKNLKVITQLCMYFSLDPEFEKQSEDYKLSKGICLCGQRGTGKTMLMRLFQQNCNYSYFLKSCLDISYEFKDKEMGGGNVIEKYSSLRRENYSNQFGHTDYGYCFDDIGDERATGNFGDKFYIFDILKKRYALLPYNATHITTNEDPGETDENGNPAGYFASDLRMRDRMRETFNVIAFPVMPDNEATRRR